MKPFEQLTPNERGAVTIMFSLRLLRLTNPNGRATLQQCRQIWRKVRREVDRGW